MNQVFLTALGLMLIMEGVLPFVTPTSWRETFRKLVDLSDGQIRFLGFSSMLLGLMFIYLSS